MGDYAVLLWFDQKFNVAEDGLVHLGSTQTLVDQITKYIKNPIASLFIGPLQKLLFKSHTYTAEVMAMLREYGNWLWGDESNHDTQVMNVKIFEASYCKDSDLQRCLHASRRDARQPVRDFLRGRLHAGHALLLAQEELRRHCYARLCRADLAAGRMPEGDRTWV